MILKGVLFWVVLYGMTGCASLRAPKGDTYTLVIVNQSWDAKTVRVFCNVQQVRTIRGLSTGETREVSVPVCHGEVRVGIEYLGDDPWLSAPFTIYKDQAVKLDIAAFRNHNTYWIA